MRSPSEVRNMAFALKALESALDLLQKMQNILHGDQQLEIVPRPQPLLDNCI
jgi:hypothetical protein